jgi:N-methylcarbamate hydrolase
MQRNTLMRMHVSRSLSRRSMIAAGLKSGLLLACPSVLWGQGNVAVEPQPYFASIRRVIQALTSLGAPLAAADAGRIAQLAAAPSPANVRAAETILARYTLMRMRLNPDGTASTTSGDSPRELVEQGWRSFLIRVENPGALTVALTSISDAAIDEGTLSQRGAISREPPLAVGNFGGPADYARRWMGFKIFAARPLTAALSGLALEYRIVELFSRDRGRKSAYLQAWAGDFPPVFSRYAIVKPTGFQADFECLPSRDVALHVADSDGAGCVAALVVTDEMGRLYPAPAHRIEPDFQFQPQVYRAHGETLRLPNGRFTVVASRGPEYLSTSQALVVSPSTDPRLGIDLKRWINAPQLGWYPGDTHIHAAGCAHYEIPTQGVTPEAMIRHVRGEALAVGDVLTWGPGYYYQKQFFSGHAYEPHNQLAHPAYQEANHVTLTPKATAHDAESLIRYDVEVSGFPSSICGHLVLLRLRDQDFPGAPRIENWPSWNLPILKWARAQGGVVGYAHSAIGLFVASADLPNYDIPRFDSIGANEFIVDLAHEAVDFVSGAEFSPVAELNFWYHTLNCGFRAAMVGETDFPCITGERVGTGRTYVGLGQPPAGDDGYAAWIEGIRTGRLYFGDGRSHFIDYRIDGHDVGAADVELAQPGRVTVSARIAARLEERPAPGPPRRAAWHLEHARVAGTRDVMVEVVVNGQPVARKAVAANGELREFSVDVTLQRSSWVALRILPSGHTHPIFVRVAGKPVRASRRSAQWCLDCIDALWREKSPHIAATEKKDAEAAYEQARVVYRRIALECEVA